MVAVLQHDPFRFRLQKRAWGPNEPGVKAQAERQRLSPNITHPKPHVQRAGVKRICRARLVTERPWTIRPQREFDLFSGGVLDQPRARKAVAVNWIGLTVQVRFEPMKSSAKMEAAAGNPVRPGNKQVVGEVERPSSRQIAAWPEQSRAPDRIDEIIGDKAAAEVRSDRRLGDAVRERNEARRRHPRATSRRRSRCFGR